MLPKSFCCAKLLWSSFPKAERLYGILTRFGHADEMKRADFGLREFLRSGGRANVDPTLTVIGLKDCTKVRRAALERLQAYSDELKKQ